MGRCPNCGGHEDQMIEIGSLSVYLQGVRVTSGLWKAGLYCVFKYKAWPVSLGS